MIFLFGSLNLLPRNKLRRQLLCIAIIYARAFQIGYRFKLIDKWFCAILYRRNDFLCANYAAYWNNSRITRYKTVTLMKRFVFSIILIWFNDQLDWSYLKFLGLENRKFESHFEARGILLSLYQLMSVVFCVTGQNIQSHDFICWMDIVYKVYKFAAL